MFSWSSYLLRGLEAESNIVAAAGDLLATRQDLLAVQENVQLLLKRPFVLQDTHTEGGEYEWK